MARGSKSRVSIEEENGKVVVESQLSDKDDKLEYDGPWFKDVTDAV